MKLIFTLNKGFVIPKDVLNYFINEENFNDIFKKIDLNDTPINYILLIIQIILLNPQFSIKYSDISINFINNNSNSTLEKILLYIKDKCEFKNINESIRKEIINKIPQIFSNSYNCKLILYWIYLSDNLTSNEKNLLISWIKKTNFNYLKNLENLNPKKK